MAGRVSALTALRSFLRSRAGNLTTMTALMAPVGLTLAAIAVDSGSLFTQRRALQSFADVAAITASNNLANPEAAVVAMLTANGFATVRIERDNEIMTPLEGQVVAHIVKGGYAGSLATAVDSRFVAGKVPGNAVRVALKTLGQRYFGTAIMAAPLISANGTARIAAIASIVIGSRLASLNGGLTNTILGGLLGSNLSLSLMDYNSLLQADVGVFDFLDKLAGDIGVTAGTYGDILDTNVSVNQVAASLSTMSGLDPRARTVLQTIAAASDRTRQLKLGTVLAIGESGYLSLGRHPSGLAAATNVLELLTGAASIANAQNQVALNLAGSIPGLLSATLDLAVGEPMQSTGVVAIGDSGQTVSTAQTRLLLTVELPGPGGILGTSIKVPIYIEIAGGQATISAINCNRRDASTEKVSVSARTGVAQVRIANIDISTMKRFDRLPIVGPANLITNPLVTVTGQAQADIANTEPTSVDFTKSDIDHGVVKTISTRDPAKSLTQSLLQNLTLTVRLAGIDLGQSGLLKASLTTALNAAAPAIDQLLTSVLDTLGISVGQLDIQATGASCPRPVLVQ